MAVRDLSWKASGIKARCRFCGGEGHPLPALGSTGADSNGDRFYLYAVGCSHCDTHTIHGLTPQEAVENWNRQEYSNDTLLMMGENTEITSDGAVRLMAAILESISEDFIRAKVMSVIEKGWGDQIRRCKRDLLENCELADIDYIAALRALDNRADKVEEKCRKAYSKALVMNLRKRRDKEAQEDG